MKSWWEMLRERLVPVLQGISTGHILTSEWGGQSSEEHFRTCKERRERLQWNTQRAICILTFLGRWSTKAMSHSVNYSYYPEIFISIETQKALLLQAEDERCLQKKCLYVCLSCELNQPLLFFFTEHCFYLKEQLTDHNYSKLGI